MAPTKIRLTAEDVQAARRHKLTWPDRERVLKLAGLYPGPKEFPQQWDIWQSESPRKVLAGGWRSSKTFSSVCLALPEVAFGFNRTGWIVGPNYANAEYAAMLLYQMVEERLGMPMSLNRNEHWFEVQTPMGAGRVEWKSAEHPTSLQTVPVNWLIVTETADVPEYIWTERLVGRLIDYQGWVILEGTFQGLNWFVDYYHVGQAENPEGWQAFCIATWENPYLEPGYVESMKAGMDRAVVDEKLGAKPVQARGLVFDKFSHKLHVTPEAVYLPGEPVYLWADPAPVSPYSVLAVHVVRDRVIVFDEVYEERISTEEVVGGRMKPFFDRKGARVPFLPLRERVWWKDVQGGAIDVRAVQDRRDWGRFGVHLGSQSVDREEWIKRINDFLWDGQLGQARMIYSPKCRGVVAEFTQFRKGIRRDAMGDVYTSSFRGPDHALSALGYGLVGKFGLSPRYGKNEYRRTDYFGRD